MNSKVLGKVLECLDLDLMKLGFGKKPLAVVARLCLPPRGLFFSTLSICEWLRLLKMSKRLRLEKVGVNA